MTRDLNAEMAIDIFLAQDPGKAETKQFIIECIRATIEQTTDARPLAQLENALNLLRAHKPHGQSELARHYAIAITDLEKLGAYITMFLEPERV